MFVKELAGDSQAEGKGIQHFEEVREEYEDDIFDRNDISVDLGHGLLLVQHRSPLFIDFLLFLKLVVSRR